MRRMHLHTRKFQDNDRAATRHRDYEDRKDRARRERKAAEFRVIEVHSDLTAPEPVLFSFGADEPFDLHEEVYGALSFLKKPVHRLIHTEACSFDLCSIE